MVQPPGFFLDVHTGACIRHFPLLAGTVVPLICPGVRTLRPIILHLLLQNELLQASDSTTVLVVRFLFDEYGAVLGPDEG